MNQTIAFIFVLLALCTSVLAAPLMETTSTVTVNIGTGSFTPTTSSSTSGGGGRCTPLWDDCVVGKCVGGSLVVTCRDLRCGRANTTSVQNCTSVDKPVLLPPLPPKYRRNIAMQNNVSNTSFEIVTIDNISGPIEYDDETENKYWNEITNQTENNTAAPTPPPEPPIETVPSDLRLIGLILLLLLLTVLLIWLTRKRHKKTEEQTTPAEMFHTETIDAHFPKEYEPAYTAIRNYLAKGYTGEQVVEAFKKQGWTDQQLDSMFEELRRRGEYK